MGLIGGSNKKTTQNITNVSNTLDLQDADVGGAVITDVNGDVNILDAGAIAAANNLSQSAIDANTTVVQNAFGAFNATSAGANRLSQAAIAANSGILGSALDSNASVVDTAFTAIDDTFSAVTDTFGTVLDTLGTALRGSNQLAGSIARAGNQQVSDVIASAADANRSETSANINNIVRYGAITVGVVALAFVFRGRK